MVKNKNEKKLKIYIQNKFNHFGKFQWKINKKNKKNKRQLDKNYNAMTQTTNTRTQTIIPGHKL